MKCHFLNVCALAAAGLLVYPALTAWAQNNAGLDSSAANAVDCASSYSHVRMLPPEDFAEEARKPGRDDLGQ